MSLKGTVILYTDLVFTYPRASFVIIDDYGKWAVVIENEGEDPRPVGSITGVDWDLKEWEDHGWEVVSPVERRRIGS